MSNNLWLQSKQEQHQQIINKIRALYKKVASPEGVTAEQRVHYLAGVRAEVSKLVTSLTNTVVKAITETDELIPRAVRGAGCKGVLEDVQGDIDLYDVYWLVVDLVANRLSLLSEIERKKIDVDSEYDDEGIAGYNARLDSMSK